MGECEQDIRPRLPECRRVLITGGAGSLGVELVSYLLKRGTTVCVLDTNEEGLFRLRDRFSSAVRDGKLRTWYGDINDRDRIERAIEGVDTVFHLAALKHVWLGNENPDQVLKVNVLGTQTLIKIALDHPQIEAFVAVSSDKAVSPSNFYGQSKAMMEGLVLNAEKVKGNRVIRFNVFRPGNFFNSSGSVIEKWLKQHGEGKAITVTRGNHRRYFIGIGDAARLLYKVSRYTTGGNIFIPRMSEYSIDAIAHLIGGSIEWMDPTPGEKQTEELFTELEAQRIEDHGDLICLPPVDPR